MKLGDKLLKILNKVYEPGKMIELEFERYDLAFKTDDTGLPVLLFIGKKDASGDIKGERFARRIVKDADGKIVKEHWDNKGKASSRHG